jgi:hypothetical protein
LPQSMGAPIRMQCCCVMSGPFDRSWSVLFGLFGHQQPI